MGSQQLLLIVVGLVIVGIMITVGLFMFRDQAAATARDAISNDLIALATASHKYYRRPALLGGGNNSFGGLTMSNLTTRPSNSNGNYVLSPDPVPPGTTTITIVGTGLETGINPSQPVQITATVMADTMMLVMNN